MDNVTLFLNTDCAMKICVNNDLFHYPRKDSRTQGTCSDDQVKVYIIQEKYFREQLKSNIIWGKWTLFRNNKIYYPWLIIIFYRIHLIRWIRQKSKQK